MSLRFFERKALFWRHEGSSVRCELCEKNCLIKEGGRGVCGTRVNKDGELRTLVYGNISSMSLNPIEKKPLYHFYPGTFALTVGTWSCNFSCPWCQNYDISKRTPSTGRYISPDEFLKLCKEMKADGTSMSFNEPTLFAEWTIEVFELARENGLYNTYITNGYMSKDVLIAMCEAGLGGMNVDVKGNDVVYRKYCGGKFSVVLRNIECALFQGVHVELTTLVIPGINDSEKMIREIARSIIRSFGGFIPWHLNRYYPAYLYNERPTSLDVMDNLAEVAREEGLKFIYIGNVEGHPLVNTYCPSCKKMVLKRSIFRAIEKHTYKGRCAFCDYDLRIIE